MPRRNNLMNEKIAKWIKEGQGEKVRIEGKSKSNVKMQLTMISSSSQENRLQEASALDKRTKTPDRIHSKENRYSHFTNTERFKTRNCRRLCFDGYLVHS